APPAPQTLAVTSGGGTVTFTAAATTDSGGPWLSVFPNSSTTPASLTVTANGGALAAGTYTGPITIASTGASNSPVVVPVSLVVTTGQAIAAAPASLSFSFQAGGSTPPAQTIGVTSSGAAGLSLTAAATMQNGSGWLSVSPPSAT